MADSWPYTDTEIGRERERRREMEKYSGYFIKKLTAAKVVPKSLQAPSKWPIEVFNSKPAAGVKSIGHISIAYITAWEN